MSNMLDRLIGVFSPSIQLARVKARSAVRHFDAASTGDRVSNWNPKNTSQDQINDAQGWRIRARMRDLVRNNRYANRALASLVSHSVGSGILPQAMSGNDAVDRRANELFEEWSHECYAAAPLNFPGVQALAVREMFEGGDGIVRLRPRRMSDGLAVPLQLEVLESDILDEDKTGRLDNGGRVVQGVEFDRLGRRVAYWLHPEHPGDSGLFTSARNASRRVRAADVVHMFEHNRTQARGYPRGTASYRPAWDLDGWQDAELTRRRIEASVAAFVIGDDEDEFAGGPTVTNSAGQTVETLEPGQINFLRGGTDVKFNQPSGAGGVNEYTTVTLHGIAAGWGVPYALVTNDLTKVNFSSSRLGLLAFYREMDAINRNVVIPALCRPVWRRFVETAVLSGALPDVPIRAKWIPPKRDPIDPLKDAQADKINLRIGSTSLPRVLAENGIDLDAHLAEIASVNEKLDALGIVLESDPRQDMGGGETPEMMEAEDDEQE